MTGGLPPPLRPSTAPPPPSVTRALHAINTCTTAAALAPIRGAILGDRALLRSTAVVSAFFLACGRLRHLDPALSLFACHPRPHVFVFNSLLRSLGRAPARSPLPLFRHFLRCRGVRPNRFTFPLLLTSLSSLADLRAVHCQVVKSGFGPDLHVRNALLARYADCDPDLAHAEQMFDEMPRPEVVAWTTMITSYRNRGRTFHALATFRRMLAAHVAPNRVTMVAALGACAAHCAVDTGIWIHEYVQKQGWEMDVVLGTALVDMYGKCGKVSDGMHVFSKMAKRNVYTWNSIIGALALAQDGKTALQWFSRMQNDGVQPDEVTLICVLCACAHAGFVDIGRKIFNLAIQGEYGFQPGIKHFGCMVDLLSRSGHLDDAFRVVETMPSQPNAVIWGLLLRGCRARGDSWLSEHVTMRLVELEPENASHYVLLSNLYAETGRWQEAQGILHWMKKKGLRKDAGWSLRMLEDKSKKYTTDGSWSFRKDEPLIPSLPATEHGSSNTKIDVSKKPWEQKVPLHNRWHPDIPPVADVTEGELFRVEMVDWTGGRVSDDNSADDIKFLDLTITHYLSGPLRIVDAEGVPAAPGDLLAVEICNLGPLPGDEWGYTAIFERENGGGFLTDHFPSARKAIWYFEGIYAYSPQIPGVRFPGLTHPGIVGTAPSAELLNIWNEREKILAETNHESIKICEVLHQRPLANLPTPENCLLGKIQEGTADWQKIANEAARTIPGRENGGNCDIKNLSRGSKVYLPVFVDGANLSTGDMHFSQGDGEVSFCGAIEMSGFLELKCEIIRGGMKEYLTPIGPTPLHVNPIFDIGPVEPRFSDWLVFEGISVDESGKQHFLDASVAYKRAVLNAIEYLSRFGYSKEQVYLLLSCCPCEGRISGIVDSPNAVATLAIPTAIFDQDVKPKRLSGKQGPKLRRLPDVLRCSSDGHLPVTQDPSGTKAP
uniref:Formamidase n=1 Tax=Oryza glumipatula TaxID=40148 RepID=A0A0D9YFD1_9ORYZ